ncbi:MAG: N-acetylneuraminate synthase [Chloroflexi bacterium]|nr:N-acetylneuraminate synthase [Chloroflexota bacterium]|tara:strand:- start:34676 stop:35683 length:1008 start_codon:yes stop_codon:yes gene_type:complete
MDIQYSLYNSIISKPPIFIAEIGGNHNGDVVLAQKMIDAAISSGAQIIKFQTYSMSDFVSKDHISYDVFAQENLTYEEFAGLANYCKQKNVIFLSTPFDEKSVDFLDDLGIPAFKIASGDLTHIKLIRYIAKKDKPIFLSTGASTWQMIDEAVNSITNLTNSQLALLHCVAAYPAPDNETNLSLINELQNRYGKTTGFSDHSLGIDVSLAAIALGAQIIEKHFTIDRSLPGGDNDISILPNELKQMIDSANRIILAIGSCERTPTDSEMEIENLIRRGLIVTKSLKTGDVLSLGDISAVRPIIGIPANEIDNIVGKYINKDLKEMSPIQWDDISN